MSEWISVKDRLPGAETDVLGWDGAAHLVVTLWAHDGCFHECMECRRWDITHWMPLPEPPKD